MRTRSASDRTARMAGAGMLAVAATFGAGLGDANAVAIATTAVPANPGLVAVDTFAQPTVTDLAPTDATTTVTTQCVPAAGELAEEAEEQE